MKNRVGAVFKKTVKPCEIGFDTPADGKLLVSLAGDWVIGNDLPPIEEVQKNIQRHSSLRQICFNTEEILAWDSTFLTFLIKIKDISIQYEIEMESEGLPEGVQRLLTLAYAVPERKGARREGVREPLLARIGMKAIDAKRSSVEMLGFIGEASLVFMRLLTGKARFRRSDLALIIQDCGPQALPIVTLISFLVGLILAYMGAVQLQMFGAQVYVASLVGLGMARVMGALMTGIIMAGRTGASFAAQLGTMQVNEEIDAFKALGISPMEFLVLPRMLALILMVPLLTLYSDLVGILAGLLVGVTMLDIGVMEYYHQTVDSLTLMHFAVGLIQAAVFGVLIAIAGCMRGIQCGRSASAVGEATTSAVVTSIVFIVVSASILTITFNILGI